MTGGLHALPASLQGGLSKVRLEGLDGIRAVSAIGILLTHMRILPLWVTLNVFFGLSGFLITWLLLTEEDAAERVSIPRFYARRCLRLFPAYYVALIILVYVVPPSAGPLRADHVWSAGLYYSNYYQAVHGATHGTLSPFWSLAIEEQFYLIWPVCFVLSKGWRAGLLVTMILGVWWQRAIVVWSEGNLEWAYHALDCRADHLLVGCLLAVSLHSGRFQGLWRTVCGRKWPVWATLMGLLACTLLPLMSDERYREGAAFYLEPWLVAVLLVQVIAGRAAGRFGWLDAPWLVWLGQRSYAFYLYHVFAMDLVGRWLSGSPLLRFLPTLLVTLVLAQLSWLLIEGPVLKFRQRRPGLEALSRPHDAS